MASTSGIRLAAAARTLHGSGGYPEVSLKRAREYRDAARQLLKTEKDPAVCFRGIAWRHELVRRRSHRWRLSPLTVFV
jgi:hypothetical protein